MAEVVTALELQQLAREAGLSMNEVCRRAGVARTVFDRWKKGTNIKLGSYVALAAVVRDATVMRNAASQQLREAASRKLEMAEPERQDVAA